MILKTLSLLNFCQHDSLTTDFAPGLNMVVGRNGAGKTNMLRGLQLALTGDSGLLRCAIW